MNELSGKMQDWCKMHNAWNLMRMVNWI